MKKWMLDGSDVRFLLHILSISGILCLPLFTLSGERRCPEMLNLIDFMMSIAAGVVSYYVCKWLDGHRNKR